jgi:hypothetical protein
MQEASEANVHRRGQGGGGGGVDSVRIHVWEGRGA